MKQHRNLIRSSFLDGKFTAQPLLLEFSIIERIITIGGETNYMVKSIASLLSYEIFNFTGIGIFFYTLRDHKNSLKFKYVRNFFSFFFLNYQILKCFQKCLHFYQFFSNFRYFLQFFKIWKCWPLFFQFFAIFFKFPKF